MARELSLQNHSKIQFIILIEQRVTYLHVVVISYDAGPAALHRRRKRWSQLTCINVTMHSTATPIHYHTLIYKSLVRCISGI